MLSDDLHRLLEQRKRELREALLLRGLAAASSTALLAALAHWLWERGYGVRKRAKNGCMCAAHLLPLMMLDLFWNKNEAHDYLLAAYHTHEKLARVGLAFGGQCDTNRVG